VEKHDLPFRTAHSVVAELAREWKEDKDPGQISAEFSEASKRVLGRMIMLSEDEIRGVMDALRGIERRKASGGPAPRAVQKIIRRLQKSVKESRAWAVKKRDSIRSAKDEVMALQNAIQR
jgi:argininosuccinate lyase